MSVFRSSFAEFFDFAYQSLRVKLKARFECAHGSACLRYLVYIQGMLGTAIVIPSYALFAVSSP